MSAGAAGGVAVLPPGVQAAPLGRRLFASVVDNAVPALVAVGLNLSLTFWVTRAEALLVLSLLALALTAAWALWVWYTLAVGAASPGMRLMKLQLVGLADGRPIGWGRVLLRQLVLGVVSATVLGFVALVVFLVLDVRRQGWHDLVARAVVIRERVSRSSSRQQSSVGPPRQAPPATSTVGLPAHLTGRQDFSGAPGSQPSARSATSAGEQGSGPGWSPGPATPTGPGQPPPSGGYPSGAPGGYGPAGSGGYGPPGPGPGYGAAGAAAPGAPDAGAGWRPPPGPDATAGPPPAQVDPRERWGRPAEDPRPAASAASATPPPPAADPEPVDDGTRVVSPGGSLGRRAPDEGWSLALEDGREVPVEGLVLIGRNPQPRDGEERAELVKVGDSSRTVSKTHLAIGVDQRGIYVVDRGSTNGSAIANSSGEYEPCAPGDVVRVREGQLVSYGQHRLEIKRSYG